MCWKLIPDGSYQPLHDITYASPLAAIACFNGKSSAEPSTVKNDLGQSVPSWLPVIETVMEALYPFEEASLAVSQALQDNHPESFPELPPSERSPSPDKSR